MAGEWPFVAASERQAIKPIFLDTQLIGSAGYSIMTLALLFDPKSVAQKPRLFSFRGV